MKKKLAIRIEVDPVAGEIIVEDDAGNRRLLKSIVMFGGDAERGILYLFGCTRKGFCTHTSVTTPT
jgi:hypothetical protein